MSIPSNKDATPGTNTQEEAKQPTLEEQLETETKRRKDTQAGYTKGQQTIKALEAENSKLLEILSGAAQVEIPKEDQERLDALMYEDPKAWRTEMDSIEKKSIGESRAKIAELTGEAKTAAGQSFELDRRQQVLKEFNDSAEVQITEELIANEVPPRITKKLAEGEISFEEFLQEVTTYVGKGKVVPNEETLEQPNMNNLGGKDLPANLQPKKGLEETYKNTMY